jgi:hypothetical protein
MKRSILCSNWGSAEAHTWNCARELGDGAPERDAAAGIAVLAGTRLADVVAVSLLAGTGLDDVAVVAAPVGATGMVTVVTCTTTIGVAVGEGELATLQPVTTAIATRRHGQVAARAPVTTPIW